MKSRKLIKATATITALLTVMSCAMPLSMDVSAATGVSSLDYGITVSKVSNSQIKLTFYSVDNPGTHGIGVAFFWDPEKYDFVMNNFDTALVENGPTPSCASNDVLGKAFVSFVIDGDQLTVGEQDYMDDFEISVILEADDGNATDELLSEFTVAVVDYISFTEGVNVANGGVYDPSTAMTNDVFDITPNQAVEYSYYVGDADGSGTNSSGNVIAANPFSLSDVVLINSINSSISQAAVTNSYNVLNHLILNNKTVGGINWGTTLSAIKRTVGNVTFACVESADANRDGKITSADSSLVMDWYSQIGASSLSVGDLSRCSKTVYY